MRTHKQRLENASKEMLLDPGASCKDIFSWKVTQAECPPHERLPVCVGSQVRI